MKKQYYLIIFFTFTLFSCATKDEIVYFQGIEEVEDFEALEQFQPRIAINDVLRIDVSSLNEEVVEPFRLDSGNRSNSGGGGNQNAVMNGYLVDVDGNIRFPVLGEVPVLGKTREELEEYLTSELKEYVTDAVVRVRIVNFKVTVLGEVGGGGVIQVPDERVTIPEIIAMAGGITYNGRRENILIIRDDNGEKTFGRVDITEADVFKSPFFYLQQNDIVYVEPTYRTVKSAGFFTSWQGIVSVITSAFSLYLLFSR